MNRITTSESLPVPDADRVLKIEALPCRNIEVAEAMKQIDPANCPTLDLLTERTIIRA